MRRLLPLATLLVLTSGIVQGAESNSGNAGASNAQASSSAAKPAARSTETSVSPKEPTKTKRYSKEKEKAPSGDKPALSEDERFTAARKAAADDPKVAELRAKTDSAKTDEAANRAMRVYLKALYSKMRALEPSLEERIDMTEAAALRAVPQPQ